MKIIEVSDALHRYYRHSETCLSRFFVSIVGVKFFTRVHHLQSFVAGFSDRPHHKLTEDEEYGLLAILAKYHYFDHTPFKELFFRTRLWHRYKNRLSHEDFIKILELLSKANILTPANFETCTQTENTPIIALEKLAQQNILTQKYFNCAIKHGNSYEISCILVALSKAFLLTEGNLLRLKAFKKNFENLKLIIEFLEKRKLLTQNNLNAALTFSQYFDESLINAMYFINEAGLTQVTLDQIFDVCRLYNRQVTEARTVIKKYCDSLYHAPFDLTSWSL